MLSVLSNIYICYNKLIYSYDYENFDQITYVFYSFLHPLSGSDYFKYPLKGSFSHLLPHFILLQFTKISSSIPSYT